MAVADLSTVGRSPGEIRTSDTQAPNGVRNANKKFEATASRAATVSFLSLKIRPRKLTANRLKREG